MMFFFWHPKPKFKSGDLVAINGNWISKDTRYMLIQKGRWMRPNGETKKQWVYDGTIYRVVGQRLERATYGSTFQEHLLFIV